MNTVGSEGACALGISLYLIFLNIFFKDMEFLGGNGGRRNLLF